MKNIILVLTLILVVNHIYSQDEIRTIKTLFKKDTSSIKKKTVYGGHGAPFVGITQMNDEMATIVGGKGGVIINHRFVFGGVGTAVIGSNSKAVLDTVKTKSATPMDSLWIKKTLSMGYGGVFVEYIFKYSSPIHLSIPLNIQVGGVLGGGDHSNIKSSTIFVVEPGVNLEFNFYKFFVPAINVSYRYVTGDYSSILSGVQGSLILKFGKF